MNRKSIGIFGLFCGLFLFLSFMTSSSWLDPFHGTFLQPNNIENLLRRTSMFGLLGIGVAFVIMTSGIDLSIGSIVCLSGCLLAIFLQVDYRAMDRKEVLQIQASDHTILIPGEQSVFAKGDTIRLFGARRAKNAFLQVDGIETVQIENGGGGALGKASLLTVTGDLSNNDDSGQIAKVIPIASFQRSADGKESKVTLDASISNLRPRDQVMLVHPKQGQKQSEIKSSIVEGSRTQLDLQRDLGSDFAEGWFAIPMYRHQRMSIPLALLSVLVIAAGLGAVHGLLITRVRLQPFIVTLCGLLIYRSVSRWLVNDQPVGFGMEYAQSLSPLGSGKWVLYQWDSNGDTMTFGIPYPLFILVGLAIAAAVFLNLTVWGRYLLALGRNEEAARYSGINTARVTMLAYVLCTTAAAAGGMLFALDANSVSPSSFGNIFELYAIAAAVLGGCSLRGGEGTIVGVIIGTSVMQMLNNLTLHMKISDKWEGAIIGAVILIGVMTDELVRRYAAKRRALQEAKNRALASE